MSRAAYSILGAQGTYKKWGPWPYMWGLLCKAQSAYIMLLLRGINNAYVLPQQNTIHWYNTKANDPMKG